MFKLKWISSQTFPIFKNLLELLGNISDSKEYAEFKSSRPSAYKFGFWQKKSHRVMTPPSYEGKNYLTLKK